MQECSLAYLLLMCVLALASHYMCVLILLYMCLHTITYVPSNYRLGGRGHTVASTTSSAACSLLLGQATSNVVAYSSLLPLAYGAGPPPPTSPAPSQTALGKKKKLACFASAPPHFKRMCSLHRLGCWRCGAADVFFLFFPWPLACVGDIGAGKSMAISGRIVNLGEELRVPQVFFFSLFFPLFVFRLRFLGAL